MSTVLNKIAEKTESEHVDLVLELFYELSSASSFDIWVMPVFGRFAQKIIEEKNDAELPKIFKFYAILCAKRKPLTKTIGNCLRRL
ncbi:unnamed protein product [Anisakis simplex]|uniref:Importin-5 n=1 Tax=Anisakis simplex TaxID=6269 RepID=A0A0M3JGP9_ANISI|nr:unnamed protein product [Anisakis simplex]